MAFALVCTACGGEVPAGRSRCGRCGSPNTAASVAAPVARQPWRKPVAIAGAAIVFAFVGVAMRSGAKTWATRNRPLPVVTASQPRPAATTSTEGATVPPTDVFAGADASREGIAAYNQGDVGSAVTQFTTAVERDPDNADALNNLGQVLVRTGRAREAIPYFDRAIAIADNVWSYHFNRAKAYGDLKEWGQAIAGYEDAVRLFPDDYVTQFNLARALQADGKVSGALEAYAKATELAPGQADFHLWYAQALDQSDNREEAVTEYHRFLELDPEGAQAETVKARLSELGEAPVARLDPGVF